METTRIPPKSGGAFAVDAGATFGVTTPEPRQVADLVAFDRTDGAAFAQSYTRDLNGTLRITTGDSLYTTAGERLLTIGRDDCGVHDILFGPCTGWMLTDRPTGEGRQDEPGGCRENLALALSALGFDDVRVPDAMNVFQKSTVTDQSYFDVRESPAEAGDTVEFRAERPATVAVTACSAKGVASGTTLTPIDVAVPDGTAVELVSVHDDRPA